MATTTNYSWTTPDDTDLVKDGASAIRSLGTAIDSTVFTNAGNAIQKSTIDAKGDLLVGTADNTVGRLAVGTNNYVLTADSNETSGLKWAAAAGGGKVLQIVQATRSTQLDVTGTSYADVLSATITPSSASSSVLVIFSNGQRTIPSSASSAQGIWNLVRASTSIVVDLRATGFNWNDVGNYGVYSTFAFNYLDAPSTTSATTYKWQVKGDAGGTTIQNAYGSTGVGATLVLMEIGA